MMISEYTRQEQIYWLVISGKIKESFRTFNSTYFSPKFCVIIDIQLISKPFGQCGCSRLTIYLPLSLFFFFKDFIYLFLGRERNTNVWLLLTCPQLGTWPTTQACAPRLGIEPATLWFAGRHSIYWATAARALFVLYSFLYF